MAELPPQLRTALDEANASVSYDALASEVSRLMEAYRADRSPAIASDLAALAYANYRMPGTYAAARSVLRQARRTIPALAPSRILDVGAGTGAGLWALSDSFGDDVDLTAVDRSPHMLALAGRLMGDRTNVDFLTSSVGDGLPPADLAMTTYVLGELDDRQREDTIRAMMAAAETVVVIEPGTTLGYRRILWVRQLLATDGFSIAAPCPHARECPLAADDWCHFAARFPRTPLLRRLKGADHGHEDEKFSYVVGTRLPATPAPGRVVRHPQKRSGMVLLDICFEKGNAERITVSRRHEQYRAARRSAWGDPWP